MFSANVSSLRAPLRAVLCISALALAILLPASPAAAAPGDWSQAQIDSAISTGLDAIEASQNPDGSIGATSPIAETPFAIIAYGVQLKNNGSLSATHTTAVNKALDWLLTQQDHGGADTDGSLGGGLATYVTGLSLLAFSYFPDHPGVADATTAARNYLISHFNAPPNYACSTEPADLDFSNTCGGWAYSGAPGNWADSSNTGFAVTGLAATGGVPPAIAPANANWWRNVQELSSNPLATRNDGAGSYTPGQTSFGFYSNANNTGSLIFGMAYAGVPGSDPKVQAATLIGKDFIDEYETVKATTRQMLFHTGMTREGVFCQVADAGCPWAVSGDGGYHYSLFALSKGLGQYGPALRDDPSNFYAKVVDLLLSEQHPDGTWPVDPRDDFTDVVATAFAIMSLGRTGQPPIVEGKVSEVADPAPGTRSAHTRAAGDALAGWVVFVDTDGNGVLNAGEPQATTNSAGTYSIQNIPEGTFNILAVLQPGWKCVTPAGCSYPSVKLSLGDSKGGTNFTVAKIVPPPPPASAVLNTVAQSPKPKTCGSRRSFKIHVQNVRRRHIISAKVTVNGKAVKVVKTKKGFEATIKLSKLPKSRYSVKITARTRGGKTLKGTRRYRTCSTKLAGGTPKL